MTVGRNVFGAVMLAALVMALCSCAGAADFSYTDDFGIGGIATLTTLGWTSILGGNVSVDNTYSAYAGWGGRAVNPATATGTSMYTMLKAIPGFTFPTSGLWVFSANVYCSSDGPAGRNYSVGSSVGVGKNQSGMWGMLALGPTQFNANSWMFDARAFITDNTTTEYVYFGGTGFTNVPCLGKIYVDLNNKKTWATITNLITSASATSAVMNFTNYAAFDSFNVTVDRRDGQSGMPMDNLSMKKETASLNPVIENAFASYRFALGQDGFGLISVFDKVKGREYVISNLTNAPLWEIKAKQGASFITRTNLSTSVRSWQETANGLELVWDGVDVDVRVLVELPGDSLQLRMRLEATAATGRGLQTITFPDVAGVKPISTGGANDLMLYTWAIGDLRPSPLVSGSVLRQDYPYCMQFTALQSGDVGLYAAEEDPNANQKSFLWEPVTQNSTLSYSVEHPVLGWGSSTLVASYTSPGDIVFGPFHGDWYDACQIYRQWALTAPWCAKGPMHSRADYPQWLAEAQNWTIGSLSDESGVENEKAKISYYGSTSMVCHAYGYYFAMDQDDRYPEYTPPKMGSEGLATSIQEMQSRGIRVVPYVQGWVWDMDNETYRAESADSKTIRLQGGGQLIHTEYGHGQRLVGMCPATTAWQNKLANVSKELVGRYNFDGIYYDFLTVHIFDCFDTTHGHAIGGGNFWTSSVRKLYGDARTELKKIRPDAMTCAEDNAEYVIDILDTELSLGKGHSKAPLFNAVYHGYTLLFGGGKTPDANGAGNGPQYQGRWWLTGNQLGWTGVEDAYPFYPVYQQDGDYYKRLISCQSLFARPYLAYGTMLRPPKITGSMPTVSGQSSYEPFTFPVIDGTAWKATDGSVGIFFLNYGNNSQAFGWSVDLAEYAGWGPGTQVRIRRWNEDNSLTTLGTVPGGPYSRQETLGGRGIIALKLEAVN